MITQTKTTTSPIILVAIVALGIIVGYFYYSQVLQTQSLPASPSLGGPSASVNPSIDDTLNKLKDLKLDFSSLDLQAFKNLVIFGESPVSPGSTGRADIFAPF